MGNALHIAHVAAWRDNPGAEISADEWLDYRAARAESPGVLTAADRRLIRRDTR